MSPELLMALFFTGLAVCYVFYLVFDWRRTRKLEVVDPPVNEDLVFQRLLAEKRFDEAVVFLTDKGCDQGTAVSWVASRMDGLDLLKWANLRSSGSS